MALRARFAYAIGEAATAFPERLAILKGFADCTSGGFLRRSVVGRVRGALAELSLPAPDVAAATKAGWRVLVRAATRRRRGEQWLRDVASTSSLRLWAELAPTKQWLGKWILRQPEGS